jgi:putative DNA primase/helicase
VLFLVGPKRSGKGTIARMLEKLVGRKNVSNPTLGDLAGPFGLWSLVGRSLAIIGDARISQRSDTAQIVENLLSISGEDGKDVHRKNLPPLRNVRLNTRFVILSNELPNLRDASGALVSRLLLLQMRQSFYGKENKKLENKLSAELPGILTWAAHGWLKLHLRGSFIEPESSQELVREFERIASPVSAFVEDCLLVGAYTSRCCDVFDAWKEWCKENGREHPGTSAHLSRELRATIPMLDMIRPRTGEGRDRCFKGIAVRAAAFT